VGDGIVVDDGCFLLLGRCPGEAREREGRALVVDAYGQALCWQASSSL